MTVPRSSIIACGSPSMVRAKAVRLASSESSMSDAVTTFFILNTSCLKLGRAFLTCAGKPSALLLITFLFFFLLYAFAFAVLFFEHLLELGQLLVVEHGANLVARLLAHGVKA